MVVLLNGAPGVGKSSLADLVVRQRPMMLALDVDGTKHALGRWDDDAGVAGRHARRLAVALIREHLAAGYDVAVAQHLARTEFIEELERVGADSGAQFVEVVLVVDVPNLSQRLRERQAHPCRPDTRSTTAWSVRRTLLGSLPPSTTSRSCVPEALASTPPAPSRTRSC